MLHLGGPMLHVAGHTLHLARPALHPARPMQHPVRQMQNLSQPNLHLVGPMLHPTVSKLYPAWSMKDKIIVCWSRSSPASEGLIGIILAFCIMSAWAKLGLDPVNCKSSLGLDDCRGSTRDTH